MEQQSLSLQKSPTSISEITNDISLYKGDLTGQCWVSNIGMMKKAFPALPPDFYDILALRVKAHGFSDNRLTDAVLHIIDTCPYPTPTIANIVSWDRTFKVFTYEEMLKKANEYGDEIWNSYKALQFKNREKKVWVHVDDIKMYNLTDEG